MVPDQLRRFAQKSAIYWIFQVFKRLDILLVRKNGQISIANI